MKRKSPTGDEQIIKKRLKSGGKRKYVFMKGVHREGTRHAVDLLCSGDREKLDAVSLEDAIVKRSKKRAHVKNVSDLKNLEMWWRYHYPNMVRAKGFVSKGELVKLMEWKISHSKWRPLLNGLRTRTTQNPFRNIPNLRYRT